MKDEDVKAFFWKDRLSTSDLAKTSFTSSFFMVRF